jgi:metallo-beta-lactamase class B
MMPIFTSALPGARRTGLLRQALRTIVALLAAFWSAIPPSLAQQAPNWNAPAAPFRIIGNVYYVGSAGLSAYLITGPKGHVLIDGGTPECAPIIEANVRTLGFRLRDIRYLLINHAHYDHAGGLAALKRDTGARLVAGAGDKAELETGGKIQRPDLPGFPPVRVDRTVAGGETIALGPIRLTALATPGHTAGATSWMMTIDGKRLLFASSITVAGEKLVGNRAYPDAARDFRATFAKLRATPADIFVNFHAEGFDLARKRDALARGDRGAFVDPGELRRQVDAAEQAFDADYAKQAAAR